MQKQSEQARRVCVQLPLKPEETQALRARAAAERMSFSKWAVRAMLLELKRKPTL